jgi:hypothetical protein
MAPCRHLRKIIMKLKSRRGREFGAVLPGSAQIHDNLSGSITRSGWSAGWDHRWVIFAVVYLVVRGAVGRLMVLARREVSKHAELLVLRHENAVLRRQIGRVRYQPGDRLWLAGLSRLIPWHRWGEGYAVTPRGPHPPRRPPHPGHALPVLPRLGPQARNPAAMNEHPSQSGSARSRPITPTCPSIERDPASTAHTHSL